MTRCIQPELMLELLLISKMYLHVPFNSIFQFCSFPEKHTLEYFDNEILPTFTGRDFGYKVNNLLAEIRLNLIDIETSKEYID